MADEVDPTLIHGFIRRVSDMRLSGDLREGGLGDQPPGAADPGSHHESASSVGGNMGISYTTPRETYLPHQLSYSTAPSTVSSTAPTTAPSAQPGHFVGQEEMDGPGPDEPERPLPCEFGCLSGCTAWFELEDWRGWMDHIEEKHLKNIYPHHTICWFCDQEFVSAEKTRQARKETFEQRLGHVWRHIWDGEWTWKDMRPDYRFLKHLNRRGLIDKEDFDHAMKYCEGPKRPEFADKSWEPPEKVKEPERSRMRWRVIPKVANRNQNRGRDPSGLFHIHVPTLGG